MDAGHAEETHELAHEDARLVDLLGSVLADPTLHTDTRMRLHQEITAIVRGTHEHVPHAHEAHQRALAQHEDHLPKLVEAALVDPDLHTDTRMRLRGQILDRLRAVDERAARSS